MVATGLLFLALATPVSGDGGVALDLSEVAVEDVLDAGREYQLPRVTVRNPGDQPSIYHMSAGGIDKDEYLDPVNEWFAFEPTYFELASHGSQVVNVTLRLPDAGLPGEYYGILRAELMPAGEGPLLGVAAAAEISFSVAEPGGVGGVLRWLGSVWTALMPWSYIVLLILFAALVATVLGKRYRFRIEAR